MKTITKIPALLLSLIVTVVTGNAHSKEQRPNPNKEVKNVAKLIKESKIYREDKSHKEPNSNESRCTR